jgi:hypothetical protein
MSILEQSWLKTDPPEVGMNMEFNFAFRIMFERGLISDTEDCEVGSFLYKIIDAVEVIITNFERFIEAYPDWLSSPS